MLLAQLRRRTATEAGGSNRNEICAMQISQVKNIHGCIFFNVPAVLFCLTPCIYAVYFQKAFQHRHGWRWFYAAAMFLREQKLVSKYCTRRYSICAGIFSFMVD